MLEVAASSIVGGEPGSLARMNSTITSSAFSEAVVFHRDYDFCCINPWGNISNPAFWLATEADRLGEALRHYRQFELLREMHKVRGFRLVLLVDVWDRVGDYAMLLVLKQAIAEQKARVGFDGPFPEPLLIYSPRRYSPEFLEDFTPNTYCKWLRW